MPDEIDLTTAAVAAQELGVAADATGLARIITAASKAVASWLGYPVHLREAVVETVAGTGSPYLFLKGGAVREIASIAVDDVALDVANYRIENAIRGRIVGSGFPFTGASSGGIASFPLHSHDDGRIEVTYSSGWVTPGQKALDATKTVDLPADLEQAALEMIVALWRRRGRDGDVASMSVGGASVSFGPDRGSLPITARTLLAPYRKRVG